MNAEEQRTWRELVWTSRLLFEALDRQLQRESGMPHTYYMILAMLSEAPQRTMTMGQLADLVRSSPSRLSHAVARLEEKSWVRRTPHPSDRRCTLAQLTDEGFSVLADAAPGHVAAVRRYVFDRLDRAQQRALHEVMAVMNEGLRKELGGELGSPEPTGRPPRQREPD